jgi:hypothetical protein
MQTRAEGLEDQAYRFWWAATIIRRGGSLMERLIALRIIDRLDRGGNACLRARAASVFIKTPPAESMEEPA